MDQAEVNVRVDRCRWHVPFEDELYTRLLGSLAEGAPWVLGPHGPIPADPWGPNVSKQARDAREHVIHGLATLRKLGNQVVQTRAAEAAKRPPSVDEEAAEAAAGR